MYAMLTGNLPFTVSPFNIKTLHTKMVNKEMNPMPDQLSKSTSSSFIRVVENDELTNKTNSCKYVI